MCDSRQLTEIIQTVHFNRWILDSIQIPITVKIPIPIRILIPTPIQILIPISIPIPIPIFNMISIH